MNNGSSTSGSHDSRPHVAERVEHMERSAQAIIDEARGAVEDLSALLDLTGRVQRHPYAMVAAAAGVGYVLAGGLFSSLTFNVVKLGLRAAAVPVIREAVVGWASEAMAKRGGGSSEEQRQQSSPGETDVASTQASEPR